jgi:hypothetical protein
VVRELLGSSDRKRLVLGFDAGCLACSSLAKRIEERVGGKIEVRSLHDPQVKEWRERALGRTRPVRLPSSRSRVRRFGPGPAGGWRPS